MADYLLWVPNTNQRQIITCSQPEIVARPKRPRSTASVDQRASTRTKPILRPASAMAGLSTNTRHAASSMPDMPPRPASALAGLVGEASAEAEANNDAAEAALERMMEYLRQVFHPPSHSLRRRLQPKPNRLIEPDGFDWTQRRELAFDMLKRIDKDNNGNIDHAELAEALRRMGVRLPSVQLRKLFRMFDTDDSGTIEIKEFTELLSATTSNNNLKKLLGRKQHANRTSQRMARSRTQPLCAPSALSSSALSADQNSAQADSVVQHSSSDPVPHARSAIADAAMRPTSALSVTWSGSESKRVEMERDALQLEFDMAVEWGETAVLQPSECHAPITYADLCCCTVADQRAQSWSESHAVAVCMAFSIRCRSAVGHGHNNAPSGL